MKSKRKILLRVGPVLVIVCTVIFVVTAYLYYRETALERMVEYASDRTSIKFGDYFTFDWDVAYHETVAYGRGEEIKELSGYDFEVEVLPDEIWRRFFFFNKGRLVREMVYFSNLEYDFSDDIEVFYPDTIFDIRRVEVEKDGVKYLCMYFELATEQT